MDNDNHSLNHPHNAEPLPARASSLLGGNPPLVVIQRLDQACGTRLRQVLADAHSTVSYDSDGLSAADAAIILLVDDDAYIVSPDPSAPDGTMREGRPPPEADSPHAGKGQGMSISTPQQQPLSGFESGPQPVKVSGKAEQQGKQGGPRKTGPSNVEMQLQGHAVWAAEDGTLVQLDAGMVIRFDLLTASPPIKIGQHIRVRAVATSQKYSLPISLATSPAELVRRPGGARQTTAPRRKMLAGYNRIRARHKARNPRDA